MAKPEIEHEEHFDVLTRTGQMTGVSKPRGEVHRDGDYHRAVHVWIFSESTQELLLQRRADCKDSWAGFWDISSAGHISAGDSSLITARRELHEELGVILPKDAFELIFIFLRECVINDGKFIDNEYNDVYLVTTLAPIPLEAFTLQESEVSAVKYIPLEEYKNLLAKKDPEYVPYDVNGEYGQLFDIIARRYKENMETRSLALQKQLSRYACISLGAEDVKGPQTVAFNLPNDERIVKDRGTSMVMLKNVSEAKFKHILQPIAEVCIAKEQQDYVDFDSFFTHTICHECCHGIGPHSITLPNGEKSTVRLLKQPHLVKD